MRSRVLRHQREKPRSATSANVVGHIRRTHGIRIGLDEADDVGHRLTVGIWSLRVTRSVNRDPKFEDQAPLREGVMWTSRHGMKVYLVSDTP